MASQRGFEPPTNSLGNYCSIQLSYWDKRLRYIVYFYIPYDLISSAASSVEKVALHLGKREHA